MLCEAEGVQRNKSWLFNLSRFNTHDDTPPIPIRKINDFHYCFQRNDIPLPESLKDITFWNGFRMHKNVEEGITNDVLIGTGDYLFSPPNPMIVIAIISKSNWLNGIPILVMIPYEELRSALPPVPASIMNDPQEWKLNPDEIVAVAKDLQSKLEVSTLFQSFSVLKSTLFNENRDDDVIDCGSQLRILVKQHKCKLLGSITAVFTSLIKSMDYESLNKRFAENHMKKKSENDLKNSADNIVDLIDLAGERKVANSNTLVAIDEENQESNTMDEEEDGEEVAEERTVVSVSSQEEEDDNHVQNVEEFDDCEQPSSTRKPPVEKNSDKKKNNSKKAVDSSSSSCVASVKNRKRHKPVTLAMEIEAQEAKKKEDKLISSKPKASRQVATKEVRKKPPQNKSSNANKPRSNGGGFVGRLPAEVPHPLYPPPNLYDVAAAKSAHSFKDYYNNQPTPQHASRHQQQPTPQYYDSSRQEPPPSSSAQQPLQFRDFQGSNNNPNNSSSNRNQTPLNYYDNTHHHQQQDETPVQSKPKYTLEDIVQAVCLAKNQKEHTEEVKQNPTNAVVGAAIIPQQPPAAAASLANNNLPPHPTTTNDAAAAAVQQLQTLVHLMRKEATSLVTTSAALVPAASASTPPSLPPPTTTPLLSSLHPSAALISSDGGASAMTMPSHHMMTHPPLQPASSTAMTSTYYHNYAAGGSSASASSYQPVLVQTLPPPPVAPVLPQPPYHLVYPQQQQQYLPTIISTPPPYHLPHPPSAPGYPYPAVAAPPTAPPSVYHRYPPYY